MHINNIEIAEKVNFKLVFLFYFFNMNISLNIVPATKTRAHIPLESRLALANFRVANAENDAQTT